MRGLLGELLSTRHDLTVADMEAGLEHLSRSEGTLRFVDLLLVVVEPYRKAMLTARRTHQLASDLGIGRIAAVANKVRDEEERADLEAFAADEGLPIIATVPYDEAVREADRQGAALVDTAPDCAAVGAVTDLLDAVEAQWDAEPVAS